MFDSGTSQYLTKLHINSYILEVTHINYRNNNFPCCFENSPMIFDLTKLDE